MKPVFKLFLFVLGLYSIAHVIRREYEAFSDDPLFRKRRKLTAKMRMIQNNLDFLRQQWRRCYNNKINQETFILYMELDSKYGEVATEYFKLTRQITMRRIKTTRWYQI